MSAPRAGLALRPASLPELAGSRERYRASMGCQVVHDSWHARGFTRLFALELGGVEVGHAALSRARGDEGAFDTLKELFVTAVAAAELLPVARTVLDRSGVAWIAAQSNDPHLAPVLGAYARGVEATGLLFDDPGPGAPRGGAVPSGLSNAEVRPLTAAEREAAFPHTAEPVGEWGVVLCGVPIATGGWFTHYNPPFADLYLEVAPSWRGRGVGAWLATGLRDACRAAGFTPAARCSPSNLASRGALLRAGLRECGRLLRGSLRSDPGGARA